jgi:serine/threonine-protein kinase RsbT
MSAEDTEAVALATSELAMNLARYARRGQLSLSTVQGPSGSGVEIESRDRGPGIADLARALQDGYSTGGGLGSGLPSARRLMDEFQIDTGPGGTRILARKWLGQG